MRDGQVCGRGTRFGDYGRQQGLLVVPSSPENKARFLIRGCGQHNSYRCQEKLPTYISEYWYSAQCCQYDYCNSWYSPQLQSASPEPLDRSLALPLSQSQILWFYQTLNLSLPLPSFPAGKEPSEERSREEKEWTGEAESLAQGCPWSLPSQRPFPGGPLGPTSGSTPGNRDGQEGGFTVLAGGSGWGARLRDSFWSSPLSP